MNYDDYAALPGVRASDLNRLAKSPLHYREHAGEGDTPKRCEERAIHCLLLEPDLYYEQFAVFRDNGGKGAVQRRRNFHLCNEDKTVLTPASDSKVRAIARGVARRPAVLTALGGLGESEMTIQWTDEATGLGCKGRIDRINRARDPYLLIDLKCYNTSDPREIARRVVSLGAHIQLAHYHVGLRASQGLDARVMILSIELAPPYDAALVELLPDGALGQGYRERARLMDRLVECHAAGQFPGRCENIVPLELPTWGRPEVGADEDGLDVDLDDTPQEMP